jgi:potassium-dependent mechanosensitive channel
MKTLFEQMICAVICCICLGFIFDGAAYPIHYDATLATTISQQLDAEQIHYSILKKKLQDLKSAQQSFKTDQLNQHFLSQLELTSELAKTDLSNIGLTLEMVNQAIVLEQEIVNTPTANDSDWRKAQEHQMVLQLQKQRYSVLQKSQGVAQQILTLTQTWFQQLKAQWQDQQHIERQNRFGQLVKDLQRKQQSLLIQLSKLNQQSDETQNYNYDSRNELETFTINEQINLIQSTLNVARLNNKFSDLKLDQNLSLSDLTSLKHQIELLITQCNDLTGLINAKLSILRDYLNLTRNAQFNTHKQLQALVDQYQDLLGKLQRLREKITSDQGIAAKQLKTQLAKRQDLPGLNSAAWLALIKPISQIPSLTLEKVLNLSDTVSTQLKYATIWQWLLGGIAVIVAVMIGLQLNRFFSLTKIVTATESRDVSQILIVVSKLFHRHLIPLLVILTSAIILFFLGVSLKDFGWLFSLIMVSLVFSLLIQLTRIVLLENITDESGHDVTLYYRLRTTLWVGAIITFTSILVNHLPVNYEIQDLVGRLFMLFLLVAALVLMKGWNVVPTLLEPHIEKRHGYLKRIIRLLSFLIPISLLSNALLGLIGYVELAWAIADYQGIFLVALVIYLLLRGLLDELIRWISEQFIRRLRNGWLWSQALLKPLHQLLKLALLGLAIAFLITFYAKWDSTAIINTNLSKILSMNLFAFAGVNMTVELLLELMLVVIILIWTAHWSREFAYRWLFAHVKDLGLRNSLAIFTQYALIALGVLVILNTIGLPLPALLFVLSTFAVGLGFGLRDLFNHFVVGIFLLVERPIKVGDWVSIGNYDGQVAHIGARSVTITTDDHHDLLVPNADIFSKNFINWTHRDSVVRVVIPIRIHRQDNLKHIKEVILDVLGKTPKILANPKPEVYFVEIDKMLLDFKIAYYIDLNHVSSRSEVRSQFLFALWERFAQENILAPNEVQEVYIQGSLNLDHKPTSN